MIKNGGIHEIIETTTEERSSLEALRKLDEKLLAMRNILRTGGRLNNIDDTII
ncbi:MAG: hypothetical protein LRY50_08175 [Geovibrio sp.]|nr:hypothetical protein [Geovibrio sp.]